MLHTYDLRGGPPPVGVSGGPASASARARAADRASASATARAAARASGPGGHGRLAGRPGRPVLRRSARLTRV